jgi:hypothetical protein
VIDTLRLTAEEALRLLERREVSARELWDAYRAVIEERDGELHCFLTLVDEPTGAALSPVYPLDRAKNADGRRRLRQPVALDAAPRRGGRHSPAGGPGFSGNGSRELRHPDGAVRDEYRRPGFAGLAWVIRTWG